MDADYPLTAFRLAFGSTLGRVIVFFASLWTGSWVGEYMISHRWHEIALLPMSSLFHMALAIAHLWGIALLLALGWMFYVLIWRDVPVGWSFASIFSLQVASINLFTPHWMRADSPNFWALIAKILFTVLGVTFFVLANRKISDP